MPDVSGMAPPAATQALEAAGFVVSVGGVVNSEVAEGSVAYTSPGRRHLARAAATPW